MILNFGVHTASRARVSARMGTEPLEPRVLMALTPIDIEGVQNASLDQPRIHAMLRRSPTGEPLAATDPVSGGETFASKIANNAGEFDTPTKAGAFIAAGLVLFILTFVVNAAARIIIERRKAFIE